MNCQISPPPLQGPQVSPQEFDPEDYCSSLPRYDATSPRLNPLDQVFPKGGTGNVHLGQIFSQAQRELLNGAPIEGCRLSPYLRLFSPLASNAALKVPLFTA